MEPCVSQTKWLIAKTEGYRRDAVGGTYCGCLTTRSFESMPFTSKKYSKTCDLCDLKLGFLVLYRNIAKLRRAC